MQELKEVKELFKGTGKAYIGEANQKASRFIDKWLSCRLTSYEEKTIYNFLRFCLKGIPLPYSTIPCQFLKEKGKHVVEGLYPQLVGYLRMHKKSA